MILSLQTQVQTGWDLAPFGVLSFSISNLRGDLQIELGGPPKLCGWVWPFWTLMSSRFDVSMA